ncbi:ATP-binding protein [Streptomyces caniferus]|uniref:hypothetical protein n=1 Tax=Streptomyces caniferus TaxID=285557 RepID=UPI003813C55C
MKDQRNLVATPTARVHELTNCLHTFAGLLDLERHARDRQVVAEPSGDPAPERDRALEPHLPEERWHEPLLYALLVGKPAASAERGVTLRLAGNWPGMPTALRAEVFREGRSKRKALPHRSQRFGLMLVSGVARHYGRLVGLTERRGGDAVFTIGLPQSLPAATGAAS